MSTRTLEILRLGFVEYDDGLDLQEAFLEGVRSGEVPDQLLLLEHPPVVTIGRNAGEENLLLSPSELRSRGVACHHTGRGGDVTFHGPGQIVGYPVMDLNPDRRDVRRYVRDLEEVIIRTLADFGIRAGRIPGLTGVWIGDLKIAAIGVRISRWITTHGFAFNIGSDLDSFRFIVPCGISERGVTSLSRVLGREVTPWEVQPFLAARFAEVFGRRRVDREISSRSVQVYVFRRARRRFEVLLLKRTPPGGGFWQPVTGIVEKGEPAAGAAVREVTEETGIRGDLLDLQYIRDFRISRRYFPGSGPHPWVNREHAFALETTASEVTLSPEHEQYLWVSPERARSLLKWRGNMRALERLEERLPR